jgi:hypothetical protein
MNHRGDCPSGAGTLTEQRFQALMVAVSATANAERVRIDIDHQYMIMPVAAVFIASFCIQHKFCSLTRINAFQDSLV